MLNRCIVRIHCSCRSFDDVSQRASLFRKLQVILSLSVDGPRRQIVVALGNRDGIVEVQRLPAIRGAAWCIANAPTVFENCGYESVQEKSLVLLAVSLELFRCRIIHQ
jgi:hypothetical protein